MYRQWRTLLPVPSPLRRFSLFLVLGAIASGLVVHETGLGLPPAARDFAGDAIWAVMIFGWVGVFRPRDGLAARMGVAVAICWLVEFSQLYRDPLIDGWRRSYIGSLVLGSGFDARDLVAYVVGVAAGASLEVGFRQRWARRLTTGRRAE
jgi:hypothetical protein